MRRGKITTWDPKKITTTHTDIATSRGAPRGARHRQAWSRAKSHAQGQLAMGMGGEGRALCCQGHEELPVPPYMGECEQVLGGKGLGDASHCLPVKRRILRPGEATERCRVALSQELNTLDCPEDSPKVCLSSLQDLSCRIH